MQTTQARWPLFRRVWRQAALMDRVMATAGIDTLQAMRLRDGAAFREARARCLSCPAAYACENWLDASDGLPMPPDFCENRDFFAECRTASEVTDEFVRSEEN